MLLATTETTMRTGKTSKGRTVPLNVLQPVDGGWLGYVLNGKGFAVSVFIPGDVQ
jgi:hypothetical protein